MYLFAIIHIYTLLYGLYHNYRFCNAKKCLFKSNLWLHFNNNGIVIVYFYSHRMNKWKVSISKHWVHKIKSFWPKPYKKCSFALKPIHNYGKCLKSQLLCIQILYKLFGFQTLSEIQTLFFRRSVGRCHFHC